MNKDFEKIKDPKVRDEISGLFEHFDKAEMTDERKQWVRDTFKTPKDFENLRIIMGIISDEEAGLLYERDQDRINESDRYEFEDRIRKTSRAIIKNVFRNLYLLTRQSIQDDAIKEALKEQEEKDKVEALMEKEKEQEEREKKGSGINT